jgi:threonine/homoserine/homoserine lactone efflux protein
MTAFQLSLAILVLLFAPGPTNSLMLLAGAERGLRRAARLIPAELGGYLLTVVPLALVGHSMLGALPGMQAGITLAAGLWVAVLALRLWRLPGVMRTEAVNARALFVTTALNPKALIFGLVLLPSPDRLLGNLVLFAGLVVAVSLVWGGFGALLRGASRGQSPALFLLRRLASGVLATMSVLLVLRGLQT